MSEPMKVHPPKKPSFKRNIVVGGEKDESEPGPSKRRTELREEPSAGPSKYLYVLGGDEDRDDGSIERYNFITKKWELLPITLPRQDYGCAVFSNKIWAVGGRSTRKKRNCITAFAIDPTNVFRKPRSYPMFQERVLPAVAVFDKRMFVAGGRTTSEVLKSVDSVEHDSSRNAKEFKWVTQSQEMRICRWGHLICATENRLFVAGGTQLLQGGGQIRDIEFRTDRVEVWTIVTGLKIAQQLYGLAVFDNADFIFVGFSGAVKRYHIDTIVRGICRGGREEMSTAVTSQGHQAVVACNYDNMLYVIGGLGDNREDIRTVEMYNSRSLEDPKRFLPPMKKLRSGAKAVFMEHE